LFYGIISIYIKNKYNILVSLKKRILYIIFGVMLLSVKGVGQVTSISLSQSTICFGDATTRLVINSNSDTWIFVERYDYSTSQWVLSNNPRQKVTNGVPLNFSILDFYNTAIYRVNYASSQGVSLSSGTTFTTELTLTVRPEFLTGAIATTGETICYGATPSVIGSLTNSGGGNNFISYSWRSSTDGYTAAITGATSSTYTPSILTSTTSYRRYANDGTCNTAATASTGTWTVTVNPTPTATFVENSGTNNNDAEICAGDVITARPLIGNSLNFDYTWNLPNGNVINGEDIYPSSGNYGLYITDKITTCQSSTITISVVVNALPVINSLMDTTKVCGTKTILDAGAYSSYLWNTGATTRYITTDITQNYSVTVTDGNNCANKDNTFLSIVDAKLFNNDTTILPGSAVILNAHSNLNSSDRAVLYDFSNSNALNDFVTLTTNSGTVTITTNGQTGNGVEVIRATGCCGDAEMKTTRENFGYGTYEVDAYSASGSADQSFGIMEQSGSWVNRVLYIGTRPDGTDNEGYEVLFNGASIASSDISPVSNSTWYKIKVYITPTSLKVWLNSTVLFDGALPSAITNPRGAIRVGAFHVSRYDNIKYTPLQELSGLWSTSEINQSITVTPTATTTYQLKVTDQTTTCNTSVDIRVLKINITNADASICNNTTQTLYIDSSFSKYASWQTKKPGIEFYNIKKDLNGNLYALPSLNNQKIYKSIDRGETWEQMSGFPSQETWNFMALGVDQNNVIYASTNNNGIYKSIDEGVTWTQLQDFGFGCGPMDILFGNNFSILTVKGSNRGIWSSTGDLFSWQKKVGGFDPNTVTQDINGNLYAGGNVSPTVKALYKYSNTDATWSNISSSYGVHIIRADSNGKVFLTEGGASPLLVSSNQGASFSEINSLAFPNVGVAYPQDILFTKNNMFITKGQVHYSKNNGANFTQLEKITFPTAGAKNYGAYGDSTNRMEMIGNRLFVATLDGIKFIDIDNLNTTVTWSTGEVGNKIVVNPISTSPGNTVTYSATVSYGAVTGSDQVTFTLPTKPTITASGVTTFCQGGTVTLTANSSPAGVYSYTWQTGAITQGINVASSGSYTVTAVNSNGCSETSIPTIITVNPLPSAPVANSISLEYNGLLQSTDLIPTSGQSISWFNALTGGVSSTKPQGINVGTYNSYANAIIDATGCTSSTRTLVFLTITQKPITITATAGQTKVYGATDPTSYAYTLSAPLLGSDVLTGALTRVSGETVGPYAIQQGTLTNTNYNITYVGNNFTITQKPLTITATAGQTKVYGATDPTSYAYTLSAPLLGSDVLTGALTRVSGETVGPYAIQQGTLTNTNYDITYVGNNFTITQKPITITATAGQTKVYGATDPTSYAYTLSAPLLGSDVLTGALTRVSGETVGPYAIQQGTLTNTNYDITYVGNNFTITQKPITITADAGQTKVYGTANPATYTYAVSPSLTGLAALNGSLTRVAGEPVGTYAIQQNDLTTANNPNYTITYVGDNFTITQKPITITVDPNQTKVYGTANPATYTYAVSPLLTGLAALNGSLTRLAGEPVGTYAIQQNDLTTANNPNYTITYVGDNFTITQKPITITVDPNQTKVYGTVNPATYTYAVSPSLTGLAALNGSLTRVAGEPVGTYAIQQNDLTTVNNPNYTITYVGNNFTITQKPITITVDPNQTKVYGTANPATYTYAVSPLLTGLAALNGSLTRLAGEPVGTYAIQQNDLTTANNPNYTITYVGDNFTITTAPLSITGITGANKIYDGTTIATINGTASYVGLVAADAGLAVTGIPSFNFNNKNVGIAKPITVAGFTAPSSNYSLTQPTGFTGDITPKTVNVIATANDKQYDGNTTATLNNITSPGFISGDLVTINYASATFDTKEVGNNKTVTVTGINLTSTDAPNYVLASSTATALANITAPPVFIFEVPNAFTPNGDGLNDLLKIISNAGIIELRSFKIFSRSGNLVFESRDLSKGWDGRFNGNLLQVDIYYWTAVYVDRNNVVNSKNGTILLLK
jgi:gliding motility-associated-like protein